MFSRRGRNGVISTWRLLPDGRSGARGRTAGAESGYRHRLRVCEQIGIAHFLPTRRSSELESRRRWLDPVITVNDVKVKALNEVLQIQIVYVLKARQERRYLNLEVTP